MIEKTKQKKLFCLTCFLVFLGLFLPFKLALSWFVKPAAEALVNLITGLFVLATIAWLELFEWLMRFVLSPDFINLSYTTNTFVQLGWSITRDFANMFFIVILVIIGLTTALRTSEYEWQKTLPRLILIALLINFTPILLGLLIDAANIAMNFFTQGISSDSIFSNQTLRYKSYVFDITQEKDWGEIILFPFFYMGFNFVAGTMYLLFAVLIIFRYIALWTLVILSPIAFICYILPATKQFFSMWWKQFVSWCLVGIFATFFIYLSDQLIFSIMSTGFIKEGNKEGWGIVNSLMPYSVVLAFLFIGFFVSITFAPEGTKAIFSAAQGGMKEAGKTARSRTLRGVGVAGKTVGRVVINPRAEVRRIMQTYQTRRVSFGDSKLKALSGALGVSTIPKAQFEAVRDVGKSFYKGAFGAKEKKERPTCSNCGNYLPNNAKFCPHCKAQMPACPNPNCNARAISGTKFCQQCGTPL